MKTLLHSQVREFHRTFGQPIAEAPAIPKDDVVAFRLRLIFEEAMELIDATYGRFEPKTNLWMCVVEIKNRIEFVLSNAKPQVNLPEFVDALADIDYVVEGARVTFGVDGLPVSQEVHRSNMSKVGGYKRPDGKWVKPDSYSRADIAGELRKQGWQG